MVKNFWTKLFFSLHPQWKKSTHLSKLKLIDGKGLFSTSLSALKRNSKEPLNDQELLFWHFLKWKVLFSNWRKQVKTPRSFCTKKRQLLRKVTINIYSLNIIKVKYLVWPHLDFILEVFIHPSFKRTFHPWCDIGKNLEFLKTLTGWGSSFPPRFSSIFSPPVPLEGYSRPSVSWLALRWLKSRNEVFAGFNCQEPRDIEVRFQSQKVVSSTCVNQSSSWAGLGIRLYVKPVL